MILAELSSGNKVVLPEQLSLNGWKQHAKVSFKWGPTGAEPCFIGDLGRELAIKYQDQFRAKNQGIMALNRLRGMTRLPKGLSPPSERDIKGNVIVLYTYVNNRGDRHPYIIVQRELMTKPEVGKRRHDYGLVAETREPGESLKDLLARAIEEEVGISIDLLPNPPRKFGDFAIPGEGAHEKSLTWVEAYSGYVPWQLFQKQKFKSKDAQTDSLQAVGAIYYMGGYSLRAGMESIPGYWLTGARDVTTVASPPSRHSKVLFRHNNGIVSNGIIED